ncbi:MAG: zinc ribbon domain-containing protein [Acidobacteria bacterium]|nr:zinc ribbon domain-containing protein [Acidobacteriota bacterium]
MQPCPACGKALEDGTRECPFCGVLTDRWKARAGGGPGSSTPTPGHPGPMPARRSPLATWAAPLALLLVVALAVLVYVLSRRPPEGASKPPASTAGAPAVTGPPVSKVRVEKVSGDFDRVIRLPGDPLGLAASHGDLVMGNRAAPAGFLRVRPAGADRVVVEKVPVTEPVNRQQIGLRAVSAGAAGWIGVADAAWFQGEGLVFTLHDPATLQLKDHREAPPRLGALVHDGEGFWAATRLDTENAPGEAWLYRLDGALRVRDRFPSPGKGCQGLAWDGRRLWFADVFSDTLFLLEVSGEAPGVVGRWTLPFDYVSGLAWDGAFLWVSEYGDKTLRRMSPARYAELYGP